MHQTKTSAFFRCSGQVGYMICNMRSIKEAFVGDTVYLEKAKIEPFKGFKAPRPMAIIKIYNKLKLNFNFIIKF